ncbi:hypothetical protein R3W88_018194 [Solanum pinnatisectum]|uniref:Uncharacterized protein n=1 Tax=Solanum pinnatisectum TaxID=50273 RepID=A0AAV9L2K6_9SOLN|nr:hypothetical protein R3W88_018194 [Solanum pinnatisectum]
MVVKFSIVIPDDIVRVIVPGSRDIVNYCCLIMRHTILFRDDNWQAIITKTWRSNDKLETSGMREHVLQALVIDSLTLCKGFLEHGTLDAC